jgi:hypothetical protein
MSPQGTTCNKTTYQYFILHINKYCRWYSREKFDVSPRKNIYINMIMSRKTHVLKRHLLSTSLVNKKTFFTYENDEKLKASYIQSRITQEESYLVSVADPYPELADGDDLLVRVGGGRLVKVSTHHVHVVGQGPQVVVRLLTYQYGQDYRKPVLRIRIRIVFGCLDSEPH